METLRCLIADIPQKILADIVQTVTQQHENIEVIGRLADLARLEELLLAEAVDILILGVQKNTPRDLCLELVEQFPGLLIISLVDDGRVAVIYLSNVGSNQLIDAIVSFNRTGMTEKSNDKTDSAEDSNSVRWI